MERGAATSTPAPLTSTRSARPDPRAISPRARYVATVLVIAAATYAFTAGGKALLLTGPAGAFWPGAGLAIAILYLGGLRWWPAILLGDLGSLLGDVLDHGVPPGSALLEAAGDVARTFLAVFILWRLGGRRIAMDRLQDVGAVIAAVAAGATVSASVAMLALRAGDVLAAADMAVFWRSWWLGDVAGGLVVLPLALAWAHPRVSAPRGRGAWEAALTLAVVALVSAAAMSADEPVSYVVFPVLIWSALRFGPQGATLAVAVAVVIAVWSASNAMGPFVEHSPTQNALNLQLFIALAATTTLCLAAIVSERRRAAAELADSRSRILAAADAERRRIGQDLHDGAQQRLVRLRIDLGDLDELVERDPASARRLIGTMGTEVDDTLTEVRSLGTGVYPALLTDHGLLEALRSLARQAPLATRVTAVDVTRWRPEVEAAVYFCCSEALQNASKHADGATAVTISLAGGDGLRFEVRDDGAGFDSATTRSGHGLANMHDRVEAIGGTLTIRSAPGEGTSVSGSFAR